MFCVVGCCSRLTSEMQMCRTELVSKESELEHLRRDVSLKMAQIGDLEERLQQAKSQVLTKSSLGTVLGVSPGFVFPLALRWISFQAASYNFTTWRVRDVSWLLSVTLHLALFLPQLEISRRSSIVVRQIESAVHRRSKPWRDGRILCRQSWPTPWSVSRSSKTSCRKPKPSLKSGKHKWTNWAASLGEDSHERHYFPQRWEKPPLPPTFC